MSSERPSVPHRDDGDGVGGDGRGNGIDIGIGIGIGNENDSKGRDLVTLEDVPQLGPVGVVGGGTMGSGIVHVLLTAHLPTILVEADEAAMGRAMGLVERSMAGAEQRGKLDSPAAQLRDELLTTSTERSALGRARMVIEAVPEVPELKASVLTDVERHLADDAVLASNTSSLSLAGLAGGLQRPARFVGTHFFNPVPVQPLLEIVHTEATDADTLARTHALARALGKETIDVRDVPGFASSRLGLALGLEAIRMVADGVASPEDIDAAMMLGYRHPMGPLRLTDLVGLDVRLGIADYLASTLGPRFEAPPLLREMVADGRLGKKSGHGFYDWE